MRVPAGDEIGQMNLGMELQRMDTFAFMRRHNYRDPDKSISKVEFVFIVTWLVAGRSTAVEGDKSNLRCASAIGCSGK